MTTMREKIKEHSRLARMRSGQEVPEFVTIPSMPEIRCVMIPLLEKESQAGIVRAAALEVIDNAAGIQARDRVCIESDIWHALREPDDHDKRVFESIDDMLEALDATDISVLADELAALMDYASPAIDGMTDEQLDELKKAFGETDWSALTGRRWALVKMACQALFPDLLRVKSLGSTSTDSSTERSESGAST
jgi:hypothetical protein